MNEIQDFDTILYWKFFRCHCKRRKSQSCTIVTEPKGGYLDEKSDQFWLVGSRYCFQSDWSRQSRSWWFSKSWNMLKKLNLSGNFRRFGIPKTRVHMTAKCSVHRTNGSVLGCFSTHLITTLNTTIHISWQLWMMGPSNLPTNCEGSDNSANTKL